MHPLGWSQHPEYGDDHGTFHAPRQTNPALSNGIVSRTAWVYRLKKS